MQKFGLMGILALALHCGGLHAAIPTFELTPPSGLLSRVLDIDSNVMTSGTETGDSTIRIVTKAVVVSPVSKGISSSVKAVDFAVKEKSLVSGRAESFYTINFLYGPDSGPVVNYIYTDHAFWSRSLYGYLKDIKTRSDHKSESWAALLIVLCFVLYWSHRRPVRTFLRSKTQAKAKRTLDS